MVDTEKIANEFAEATKLMDKSVDTDIDRINRRRRKAELSEWNEDRARAIASEEGIELTDAYLNVVHSLFLT